MGIEAINLSTENMNTSEIDCLVRKGLGGKGRFLGVFPRDRIPSLTARSRYSCSYVSNTDPAALPGSHWVAFYHASPRETEFFDSYGEAPSVYSFNARVTSRSTRPVQMNNSGTCGHHFVSYVTYRTLRPRSSVSDYVRLLYNAFPTKSAIDRHIKGRIDAVASIQCAIPNCAPGSQCCKPRCIPDKK